MSQEADHGARGRSRGESEDRSTRPTVNRGLEALRSSPEFGGPVEMLDCLDHLDGFEACEHIALLYKSDRERFNTVVPFIREGLGRGERVMYVVDELSESEVLRRLRGGSAAATSTSPPPWSRGN